MEWEGMELYKIVLLEQCVHIYVISTMWPFIYKSWQEKMWTCVAAIGSWASKLVIHTEKVVVYRQAKFLLDSCYEVYFMETK